MSRVNREPYCDSLSSLYAFEHYGLARYGDSTDHLCSKTGLINMSSRLMEDEILYLSVSICQFLFVLSALNNANRVFNLSKLKAIAEQSSEPYVLNIYGADTGASIVEGWAGTPESYASPVPA